MSQWLPGFVPTEWPVEIEPKVPVVQRATQPQGPSAVRLSAILDSSTALPALRHFATTEYSDYPLHFWWVRKYTMAGPDTEGPQRWLPISVYVLFLVSRLEAESYRTLPRADLLLARGRAIAEKYIAPEAIRTVPLSEPVRDKILARCDSALVGPGLFIEAQTQVRHVLPSRVPEGIAGVTRPLCSWAQCTESSHLKYNPCLRDEWCTGV
jgi:hypothetical protein